MIGRMPDLGVSQKGCQISRCPSLGMFGSVWECLGISRAAVVRFAERTGGVVAQLYPNGLDAAQLDAAQLAAVHPIGYEKSK